MKYVIYCRKSSESEDKQALSIESQESEMLQIAEKLNLSVVLVLKESKSAKQPDRPIFNEMMKMIEQGKADGILCWKLDRLARNPIDGGKIAWLLQKGQLQNIKTFDRDYYPTDNVLMMAVEFGMSNQYIRDLSENVKRGNRTKLERGEYPNTPPVGYLNDKLEKKIIVDETRKKYVIRAFELYSTGGYGFKELSHMLYAEGFRTRTGKRMLTGNMQVMLKDTFYYGVMLFAGKFYKGNHTPLISKALYDKAQEVAEKRKHPHRKKLFFPLSGFVLCETCGCMYTASLKKGHDYYYCTNGKGICTAHKSYMRENVLYPQISLILETLRFDPELIDIVYESAKEQSGVNSSYFNDTLTNLTNSLKPLLERESRLLDAFLDSSINKEIYDKKSLEIQNSIFEIKQSIQEIEQKKENIVSTLEPTRKLFLDCILWADSFLELEPDKKHEVVKNVLWNFTVKDKNIFKYQLKSPYNEISKAPKNGTLEELRTARTWNGTP